jgi:hypothetical protein
MQMTMIRFESGDAAHTNFIYPTKGIHADGQPPRTASPHAHDGL